MAKTMYFQSGLATCHRGVLDTKLDGTTSWWRPLLLAESRGASATTLTAASIAGTTNGIEIGVSGGGIPFEWISEPLSADFTISGTITGNMWGFESTMSDNTAINFVVDKMDGATGAITQIVKSARVTELATANGVNNFTATPPSGVACKRGDRLRVRAFIDDIGSAMAVGTSTFSYNGPTAAAAGDSYVTFTENLTFEPAGNPSAVYNPLAHGSSFDVGLLTAGVKQVSQPFVALSGLLVEVKAWLRKINNPTGDFVIELQTDSSGLPSGTVLTTLGTVPPASLTGVEAQFTFTPNITLTKGTTYHVVFRMSGTGSDTDNFNVGANNTLPPGFTRYCIMLAPGTTWSAGSSDLIVATDITFGLSTYYLTDTAESINPGSATEKKALTTRGSGSVNAVTNTAAGPTSGIQITASAGGTAIEWYTPPVEAITLGGKAKVVMQATESNASANASIRCEIAVCATDGSGATVWGTIAIQDGGGSGGGEIQTSAPSGGEIAWVSGDDVSVTAGQRLRFRIYLEDTSTGPLVTGFTATVSYNGTTALAAGDTYVLLPVLLVEQAASTPYAGNEGLFDRRTPRRRTSQRISI